MIHCKYHPSKDATYFCKVCNVDCCDQCTDVSEYLDENRCFKCNSHMQQVKQNQIKKPFWRRLQASFRYPLDIKTLGVIALFVLISGLIPSLPFKFILSLIVFGTLFKYLFTCLKHTAMGEFNPPDPIDAIEGGFVLALKVIGLFVVLAFVIKFMFDVINYQLAAIVTFAIFLLLPAIVMVLALTDSLVEALNPMNVIHAAVQLGLQYLVFLGFIFVMIGSAEVLNSTISLVFPQASSFLSACVGIYYLIVAFHIMGYMVYENQGKLLKQESMLNDSDKDQRTPAQRALAKANIFVKEGLFNHAVSVFDQGIKDSPQDYHLHTKYFEFLMACHASDQMSKFGGRYLNLLIKTHRNERIYSTYRNILELTGSFQINLLQNKLIVARACYERGNNVQCVKLLNGVQNLHKDDPDLIEAFQLLHDALIFIPGQEETGKKVRAHLKALISKKKGQDSLVDRKGLVTDTRIAAIKNTNETMRNQTSESLDDKIKLTKKDMEQARNELSRNLKISPENYLKQQEDLDAPLTLEGETDQSSTSKVHTSPFDFESTEKEEGSDSSKRSNTSKSTNKYQDDFSPIEFN
ncbi:hypothetical protein [Marinicellulosiphila megalodicopiae]|uniref:hypothetical protein n=1 Tax=Marinicellulosiphila megalodicopiae TaxID=2724896 RepID=UPI003BAEF058